jgi:hypothetical protein
MNFYQMQHHVPEDHHLQTTLAFFPYDMADGISVIFGMC